MVCKWDHAAASQPMSMHSNRTGLGEGGGGGAGAAEPCAGGDILLLVTSHNRAPKRLRDAQAQVKAEEVELCAADPCASCDVLLKFMPQDCSPINHDARAQVKAEEVELVRRDYAANGGWETFLAYEDVRQDILVGLLRLRRCFGPGAGPPPERQPGLRGRVTAAPSRTHVTTSCCF